MSNVEVYALIGPSGTGKSHHASLVAYQHDIDVIIDDGLVIAGGKIVAGKSAKREATRVAAVKRALFIDPEQKAAALNFLETAKPPRVLVLGTSDRMATRICQELGLPAPTRVFTIEEVSTPMQIRRARRLRQEGKHVVPAPTMEVRRTFGGYMVDPLRLILRRTAREPGVWVEKSVVRPTYSSLGRFTIDDVAVAAIAARAIRDQPGIARVRRVAVDKGPNGIRLDIDVVLRYGPRLDVALHKAQRAVYDIVEYMTALNIVAINIAARRIVFE